MVSLIYWRKLIISANTIGFGEEEALQINPNILPIPCDVAYQLSCSKRKTEIRSFMYMFKLQITLDRHSLEQKLSYCVLPDPANFRYYLPFKVHKRDNFLGSDFEFCTFL
jgi:hypothetical protein